MVLLLDRQRRLAARLGGRRRGAGAADRARRPRHRRLLRLAARAAAGALRRAGRGGGARRLGHRGRAGHALPGAGPRRAARSPTSSSRPAETGSGRAGRRRRPPLPRPRLAGRRGAPRATRLAGWEDADVALETIEIRSPCGALRAQADVDQEAALKVERAVAGGAFALLHVLDASKTGRPGVSRAAASRILARHPRPGAGRGRRLPAALRRRRHPPRPGAGLRGDGHRLQVRRRPGVLRRAAAAGGSGRPAAPRRDLPARRLRPIRPRSTGRRRCAGRSPRASPIPPTSASACAGARRWPRSRPTRPSRPPGARAMLADFDRAVRGPCRRRSGPGARRSRRAGPAAPGLIPIFHVDGADPRARLRGAGDGRAAAAGPATSASRSRSGASLALRVCASMPMITDAAERGFAAVEADLDEAFESWARLRA